MIDVFYLYQSFQSYANTFQGSHYRPNTDFLRAVNDISKQLWEEWTGMAEKSQEIRDHLAPFLKSKNQAVKQVNASYGTLSYPNDYGRFSSARILIKGNNCVPCSEVDNGACEGFDLKTQEEITDEYFDDIQEAKVELIDNQRWAACLTHLTKKPTFEFPKITQFDGGWKVAPRKVSVIVLDYYIRPKDATFKYTIAPGDTDTGAGDYIIYDNSSVKLEWPETTINEFIIRLGIRFSIFTRDQFMNQASNIEEQKL